MCGRRVGRLGGLCRRGGGLVRGRGLVGGRGLVVVWMVLLMAMVIGKAKVMMAVMALCWRLNRSGEERRGEREPVVMEQSRNNHISVREVEPTRVCAYLRLPAYRTAA